MKQFGLIWNKCSPFRPIRIIWAIGTQMDQLVIIWTEHHYFRPISNNLDHLVPVKTNEYPFRHIITNQYQYRPVPVYTNQYTFRLISTHLDQPIRSTKNHQGMMVDQPRSTKIAKNQVYLCSCVPMFTCVLL